MIFKAAAEDHNTCVALRATCHWVKQCVKVHWSIQVDYNWRYRFDNGVDEIVAHDQSAAELFEFRRTGWRVNGNVAFVKQHCELEACTVFFPNTLQPAIRDERRPTRWHAQGQLITVAAGNMYEVLILLDDYSNLLRAGDGGD